MTYLLPKLAFRSFIGFDDFFNEIESYAGETKNTYPPYNIRKVDEDNYIIEMAVAGFSEKDLEISVKDNMLTIEGNRTHDLTTGLAKEEELLYKGLAERSFKQSFRLQEYVEIEKADLNIGILSVFLKRNLPEAKKPRIIKIQKLK
jgi:molecular chaperone IbpA